MKVEDYQEIIEKTAVFPEEIGLTYCTMGLCGEAGEVAEKIKKLYRDKPELLQELQSNQDTERVREFKKDLTKELGDVVWYVTALSNLMGVSLKEVLNTNYQKLINRRKTNTLHGDGDNREEV